MDSHNYKFFGRDLSWLSFNKRVLLEALDATVPLYERLNFLSIFSSNLEEFYQIRVSGAKASIKRRREAKRGDLQKRVDELEEVIQEIKKQELLFRSAWEDVMVRDLKSAGVDVYTHFNDFTPEMREQASNYFWYEIFPFLQPVLLSQDIVKTFIRDKRIYLGVHLRRRSDDAIRYYMIKLPFTKAPRFFSFDLQGGRFAYTFVDEIIRMALPEIFLGFEVLGAYSFKVSRDADIVIDEDEGGKHLAENIEELISKRKVGIVTRFQYDSEIPHEMLKVLKHSFKLKDEDLLEGRRHLQLQDLRKLPNPLGSEFKQSYPLPQKHTRWDQSQSRIEYLLREDEAIFVPYISFDYLLDTLREASKDSRVRGIKLTQYRVAEDSDIIDTLIKAASNGKEVTVFVELKARFDEENNLQTAQRMRRHGVKILYSLPGLKVHAKTSLIEFHPNVVTDKEGIAIFSTGNFNEKTAKIYSDVVMFTSRREATADLSKLFALLENGIADCPPTFEHLLIASYGMAEQLHSLIDYEIDAARRGEQAEIILKLNSVEEQRIISKLYEASDAGVKITLLVRGICCVVPDQEFSKNIKIIRLVDIYLEHARILYFYHSGEEQMYIASADWMTRNLYRRIECAAPVVDLKLKQFLKNVLQLCISDNVKAVYINEYLENIPKRDAYANPVRTQMAMYDEVKRFVMISETKQLESVESGTSAESISDDTVKIAIHKDKKIEQGDNSTATSTLLNRLRSIFKL